MALVILDRVKETTTTTGTGTVTLLGAVTGYQSFAGIGNGNTTYYCIADQTGANWEVGIGTYTSAGTTLARTTVLASSNSGSLVSFTAGTKDVFVTYPSERAVATDIANTFTANQTINGIMQVQKAARGDVLTDNDGSFDMNASSNFSCTPTGAITLTFTNIAAGQSGYILLVNSSNYAVTAAATTKCNSSFLLTVSYTGTYLISYFSNGTNVYVTTAGAMS